MDGHVVMENAGLAPFTEGMPGTLREILLLAPRVQFFPILSFVQPCLVVRGVVDDLLQSVKFSGEGFVKRCHQGQAAFLVSCVACS